MNTTEAAELAAELRKAAQNLLLCVNIIVGQEQSLAADLQRPGGDWSCWPCAWPRASPIYRPSGRSGMHPVKPISGPAGAPA